MEKKSKYDTNPLDPDFVRRTEEMRGRTGDVEKAAPTEEQTRAINGGGGVSGNASSSRDGARGGSGNSSGPVDMEAPTRYYAPPSQFDSARPSTMPAAQPLHQARYEEGASTSYPSIFIPPAYQPPQDYRPPLNGATPQAPFPFQQAPTSRTVPGLGLPENIAMILPYLPFPMVGLVPGLLELLLVSRAETRLRFHAAQGLALHLLVLAVSTLFGMAQGIMEMIRGPFSFLLGMASTFFTIATIIFFIVSMVRVWKGEPHIVAPLADATRWLNEKLEPRK